jgi:hypothetical protein
MFAGSAAVDLIVQHLNGVGNVMSLEANAHAAYVDLRWGIEAQNENGLVRISSSIGADITNIVCKVKYIYRRIPHAPARGPGFIRLQDGEEIEFGGGPEAKQLGPGPLPLLCNIRLAVARALKMTGAAGLIAELKEDADDGEILPIYLSSDDFSRILSAMLLVSGRALIPY